MFLLGPLFDRDDDPGVDGLPDEKPGQAGDDQLCVGADDVLEVLLIGVEVGRGR